MCIVASLYLINVWEMVTITVIEPAISVCIDMLCVHNVTGVSAHIKTEKDSDKGDDNVREPFQV